MKRFILFLLLFFYFHQGFSQKQTNFWYFGTLAGVNFNSGTPVALTNGPINQNEGTASISDASGNLIFFTDGMQVWDRTSTQMPNGFGLFGNGSTTQSALIIPDPGNANLFYIFTLDWEGGSLYYSVVDMTLNSGNGDVTIKNSFLMANMTEKLTAVHHCNNHDIWVTAHQHNTDAFVTYLVTNSGISAPIINNTGTVHSAVHGQMKYSTDGNRIACAIAEQDVIEFFDFDKSTGTITNPQSLLTGYTTYGVEFSPDNTKLYASYYDNGNITEVAQFDLTASNIPLSKIVLYQDFDPIMFYGLQLASDNKIYVASENVPFLSVINSPNITGSGCNYVNNAVNLDPLGNGSKCMLGLPGFIQSYFNPSYPNIPCNNIVADFQASNDSICRNTCISLTDLSSGPATSWQWSFPGAIPSSDTSQNPTVCYTNSGSFPVTLIASNGSVSDTITKSIFVYADPVANAGTDVSIFGGDSVTLSGSGGTTYVWSPAANLSCTSCQSTIASPPANSTYLLTVTDAHGCTDTDNVNVFLTEPTLLCGEVFVPTAFSPNNDAQNDVLYVKGNCITSMELAVFDRWGEKVFYSTDQAAGWDGTYNGKLLDNATFAYYLKGTLQDGKEFTLKGNISLIK